MMPFYYGHATTAFTQKWDAGYVHRFPGRHHSDMRYTGVDYTEIYKGIDKLVVPVAGDSTGIKNLSFMAAIPALRYKTQSTRDMVMSYILSLNTLIREEIDRYERRYCKVPLFKTNPGYGKTRKFYFLPEAVVGGAGDDGFYSHELPMMEKTLHRGGLYNSADEYEGFYCAGRYFALYSAPTFEDPHHDKEGPKYYELNAHDLPMEARLHKPRIIWPGLRTPLEDTDARMNRVRQWDCIKCRAYNVLLEACQKRVAWKRHFSGRKTNLTAEIEEFSLDFPAKDDIKKEKATQYAKIDGYCQTELEKHDVEIQVFPEELRYNVGPYVADSPQTPMRSKKFLPFETPKYAGKSSPKPSPQYFEKKGVSRVKIFEGKENAPQIKTEPSTSPNTKEVQDRSAKTNQNKLVKLAKTKILTKVIKKEKIDDGYSKPAPKSKKKPPIVIDLVSDEEEDNEGQGPSTSTQTNENVTPLKLNVTKIPSCESHYGESSNSLFDPESEDFIPSDEEDNSLWPRDSEEQQEEDDDDDDEKERTPKKASSLKRSPKDDGGRLAKKSKTVSFNTDDGTSGDNRSVIDDVKDEDMKGTDSPKKSSSSSSIKRSLSLIPSSCTLTMVKDNKEYEITPEMIDTENTETEKQVGGDTLLDNPYTIRDMPTIQASVDAEKSQSQSEIPDSQIKPSL